MKETKISAPFAGVIKMMNDSDIKNALVGSCNLVANMLNDFSQRAVDEFAESFTDEHGPMLLEHRDIEDYLENPDIICCDAAWHFAVVLGLSTDMDYDRLLRIAQFQYDGEDNVFIFCFPWSNCCADYYIIGSDELSEAIEILTEDYDIESDEIMLENLLAQITIE